MRAALALVAFAACTNPPRVCAPWVPGSSEPMGLEGARDAHRWAALEREVRFEEARAPGWLRRVTAERVPAGGATASNVCFSELYVAGRLLFEHEHGRADGLGHELGAVRARSPFRRVHEGRFGGPETNGCRSCHWRGGRAGAGDFTDAALLFGDGDAESSADSRNPPALLGGGVVEALGRQLTAGLLALKTRAVDEAKREGRDVEQALQVQGIDFGVLHVSASGAVDATSVRGVDADLVVRPFGWKGTFASLDQLVRNAFQVHVGVQAAPLPADAELLGSGPAEDPDRDGVRDELTEGQLDAVVAFLAAQPVPVSGPVEHIVIATPAAPGLPDPIPADFRAEQAEGRDRFTALGCASCHVPQLMLNDARLPLGRAGTFAIDLASQAEAPRIARDDALAGFPVALFSDLRRHDLGEPARHVDASVARAEYLTRPLWGLADSAPYSVDGRSVTVDEAIARHGGEAAQARAAFAALTREQQGAVRVFLMSLRRGWAFETR